MSDMKSRPESDDKANLRREAEQRLQINPAATVLGLESVQLHRLVHELQVHQVELEIQNEELRRSRDEIEKGFANYRNLFEFAPVAYFNLDSDSTIRLVNLTGSTLLGIERSELTGRRFADLVDHADRQALTDLLVRVFDNQGLQTTELHLTGQDKSSRIVRMNAVVSSDGLECRTSLTDLTELRTSMQLLGEKSALLLKSERFLSHAEKLADTGAWEWELKTDEWRFSEGWSRIHGCQPGVLRADELMSLAHPDDADMIRQALAQVCSGEKQYNLEHRIIKADTGEVRWIKAFGELENDEFGNQHVFGVVWDITESKTILAALRESERFNRATIDAVPDTIAVLDAEGTILKVNRAWRDFAIANGADWRKVGEGSNYLNACESAAAAGDKYAAETFEGLRQIIRGDRSKWMQEYPCHSPGKLRWFYCRVSRFVGDGPVRLAVVHTDISKTKHVEQALERSRRWMQTAVRAAEVGLWDWDLRNNAVFFSREWKAQLGYQEHEIPDEFDEWRKRVHPDDLQPTLKIIEAYIKNPWPNYEVEYRMRHKDGSYRWIFSRGALELDDKGQPVRMLGSHIDQTERKAAEALLRMRDRAIQAVTQGIVISDPTLPDNPIIYVNRAYELITGYSSADVIGRNCRFLQGKDTDPKARALISGAIRSKQPVTTEILNYRKDGTPFWNEVSITPVQDVSGNLTHFVGIQADVTHRRNVEEQLRQSQKIEAIGQLAGGIAHDFNNMLTAINGHTQILLKNKSLDDSTTKILSEIYKAGQRAKDLTGNLLAFGRRQMLSPQTLDLNAVIVETASLLKSLIGDEIVVTISLDPRLKQVNIDRGQITQVLMNLAINARDAMPEGGQLLIETSNADRKLSTRQEQPIKARPCVVMSVSDTGHGMTEEVRTRIFEPFFTTKAIGMGTGLGLSTVYGIVTQSGGDIQVTSNINEGTRFEVCLPCSHELAANVEAPEEVPSLSGGTETILVVEDEELVRMYVSTVLASSGYTVLEAANGTQALKVAREYPAVISLVLTDMTLPGISGLQLVSQLRIIRPEIRAIAMSGYSREQSRVDIDPYCQDFVQKPFSPEVLEMSVRKILDSPKHAIES